MKKPLLALALALCLPLSGCAALLERSYETSTRHEDRPVTAEDDSYVRVENYQELVSAVLYLVEQGEDEGVIRLYDYPGDVSEDLSRACLEVSTEDPLGAYAVDYIKHDHTRVVSYYQATLSIRYRRTPEQIASVVHVVGAAAIRARVQRALAAFDPEVVLWVAYFAEDEASLTELIREAYLDAPATALGFPEIELDLYPAQGRERVVEIVFTYPEPPEDLRRKSGETAREAAELSGQIQGTGGEAAAQAAQLLAERAAYDPQAPSTAYAALVEGQADSEGLALALELLCREAGLECQIQAGELAGEARTWTSILGGDGRYYLDPAGDGALHTARELAELGYTWPGAPKVEAAAAAQEEAPAADG